MKKQYEEVEVDLTEHEFYLIALKAHERNITFNQMAELILKEEINKYERKTIPKRKNTNTK